MNRRYRVYYWSVGLGLGVWDKFDNASTFKDAEAIERRHRSLGRRARIEEVR